MNIVKISIPENFTFHETGRFRDHTFSLISDGKTSLEIDFSNCKVIDSTGIGALVSLLIKCKENGCNMELNHLHGNVKGIFKMTKLDEVFSI